jgi:hypothetical protein
MSRANPTIPHSHVVIITLHRTRRHLSCGTIGKAQFATPSQIKSLKLFHILRVRVEVINKDSNHCKKTPHRQPNVPIDSTIAGDISKVELIIDS